MKETGPYYLAYDAPEASYTKSTGGFLNMVLQKK